MFPQCFRQTSFQSSFPTNSCLGLRRSSSSISPPLLSQQLFYIIFHLFYFSVSSSFPFSPTPFLGPCVLYSFINLSPPFSLLGQVGRLVLLFMTSARTKRVGPSHLHSSLTTTMNHTLNLTQNKNQHFSEKERNKGWKTKTPFCSKYLCRHWLTFVPKCVFIVI